jgi:hypothetical protein
MSFSRTAMLVAASLAMATALVSASSQVDKSGQSGKTTTTTLQVGDVPVSGISFVIQNQYGAATDSIMMVPASLNLTAGNWSVNPLDFPCSGTFKPAAQGHVRTNICVCVTLAEMHGVCFLQKRCCLVFLLKQRPYDTRFHVEVSVNLVVVAGYAHGSGSGVSRWGYCCSNVVPSAICRNGEQFEMANS